METFYIDCSAEIPKAEKRYNLAKNAWISPSGDFYGFKGAKHELAATWIAVFKLGADDKSLNHGTFFKDCWESYLLRNGWLCIKNTAWLGGKDTDSIFKSREPSTEKQKSRLFDYCEEFGLDYRKKVDGE